MISDAKLHGAASQLVGLGFSQDCDWHSQQNAVKRGSGVCLKKFDPESERKWQVCKLCKVFCASVTFN